jgi:phenylacetaldehyde dehydrogenase
VAWNFPLLLACWKLGPALATGCTVVLKPAEDTPLTALRLGELALEAGYPPGVLNVVPGLGGDAGAALSSHPDVDKLTFTGSTGVGKLIGKAAMDHMTRVTLELGGKSPTIVLEDADPQEAAAGAANAIFFNQGQVCCAGSRLYVQRKLFDNLVADITDIAGRIRLGNGLDPNTEMGPLVSAVQQQRVHGFIEKGLAEGARITTGGDRQGPVFLYSQLWWWMWISVHRWYRRRSSARYWLPCRLMTSTRRSGLPMTASMASVPASGRIICLRSIA